MKRLVIALLTLFCFSYISHAQERIERHVPPEGLVKSIDMPLSWEDKNTLLLYSGTMQKPSFYKENIRTGKREAVERRLQYQPILTDGIWIKRPKIQRFLRTAKGSLYVA